MKLPSGGIMFGYCLRFCVASSSSVRRGPYVYCGLFRLEGILAGCDGGRNLSGFSSTRGLDSSFLAAAWLRRKRSCAGVGRREKRAPDVRRWCAEERRTRARGIGADAMVGGKLSSKPR